MGIADELADLPLVDQHCHPIVLDPLDRAGFELLLTEAAGHGPTGTSELDSQVGLAVRRWCAPELGLDRHAQPEEYLTRRAELGPRETGRRLLGACGTSDLLVDTGLQHPGLCAPGELAELAGARVHEVTRVETVVEQVAASGVGAADLGGAVADALAERATRSVGFKTIAAYRIGLELPAAAPTTSDVRRAADRWLADGERTGRHRLDEPTLVAHAVHACLRLGLPLQVHTGYGDPDVTLHRADPSLLTAFLRALPPEAGPVVLLHCYPYHRQAAYLANVFPQVALDVSLAVSHVGPRAAAVLAETLELAPFGSLLYASDGFGLPELHHLGAVLFRRGLARVLDDWLAEDALSADDAARFARMISADNARRIYRLDALT
ncbi:MAG TPA: amidohydrolase family protein [Nocardioides sp.]|uniref:amidohydrolase family protein n=1 Tax=Nocardioides sp. TaxID=35761 RepID=UPI002D7EF395|nr:amidohydrolase family protein [Nocardioides sp.]HET6654295.1 amidohydrolase family protein [Nocardioides sp.]